MIDFQKYEIQLSETLIDKKDENDYISPNRSRNLEIFFCIIIILSSTLNTNEILLLPLIL